MGRSVRLWHRCRGIANGKWGWVGTEVAEGSYVQWDFNRGDYGHRHSIDMGGGFLSPSGFRLIALVIHSLDLLAVRRRTDGLSDCCRRRGGMVGGGRRGSGQGEGEKTGKSRGQWRVGRGQG